MKININKASLVNHIITKYQLRTVQKVIFSDEEVAIYIHGLELVNKFEGAEKRSPFNIYRVEVEGVEILGDFY